MTTTKPHLRAFLEWMEGAFGDADQGTRSEFAHHPPPGELAMAEVALEAAVKGDRPVLLATSSSMECVIGGLVLKRAGVALEQVFQGSLTDDQFEALANTLRAVKNSQLLVELQVEQPGFDAGADH